MLTEESNQVFLVCEVGWTMDQRRMQMNKLGGKNRRILSMHVKIYIGEKERDSFREVLVNGLGRKLLITNGSGRNAKLIVRTLRRPSHDQHKFAGSLRGGNIESGVHK